MKAAHQDHQPTAAFQALDSSIATSCSTSTRSSVGPASCRAGSASFDPPCQADVFLHKRQASCLSWHKYPGFMAGELLVFSHVSGCIRTPFLWGNRAGFQKARDCSFTAISRFEWRLELQRLLQIKYIHCKTGTWLSGGYTPWVWHLVDCRAISLVLFPASNMPSWNADRSIQLRSVKFKPDHFPGPS